MSARVYRLLRNNKEEGPFTAEELIHKNLKTYDLIWADGRSTAWSYPGEMAEFKTYAPLPGEQASVLQMNKQDTAAVSASVQAAIVVNENIAPSSVTTKPRYKVSAAWSKIQTITAAQTDNTKQEEVQKTFVKKDIVTRQPATVQSKSLSWKEAWLDWEKEKSAAPVFQPKQVKEPVTTEKIARSKNAAPVLETKYTEPLDSLKDKYINNIIQQKQKSKRSFSFGKISEFIIPSLALLIIFSAAYWLLHDTGKIESTVNSVPANTSKPVVVQNTPAPSTPVSLIDDTVTNNISQLNVNENESTSTDESIINDQAEDRKNNPMHSIKLAVSKDNEEQNNVVAKQDAAPVVKISNKTGEPLVKQIDSSTINKQPVEKINNNNIAPVSEDINTTDNRPVRRRTDGIVNSNNQPADNPPTEKTEKPIVNNNVKAVNNYVTVPEYIEMANGSANLKIQNVSDVDLDLVVIDVQYYDASNHFRKGETLYLHNLKAGKNIIIKTPKDLSSYYATSKISLISSDEKHVYVVGDN